MVSDNVQVAAMRIRRMGSPRFMGVRRKGRAGVTLLVYSIEKYVGLRQMAGLRTDVDIRLLRVEAGVEPMLIQQLAVCALFDQAALV